jgi:polypeptide N-acetylgalactosaminyltransferase
LSAFRCQHKLYLKHLPPVTIIVIFHNEHPSLIKRTLHSIFNRTPGELLSALILVNDGSTKRELYGQFESYVEESFPPKVTIVKLETRQGLIRARLEGAKRAMSEILVFLDSHVEVNTNWLPPLIEPVALNPRTSTVPIHDEIRWRDFAYVVTGKYGHRGLFTWDFDFRVVKRTAYMISSPKAQPVMLGCAFAINREYFWHLGGYDEELLIWNGEKT